MAASGTYRRMASSAPGRSQGGNERDSRRARVARFWRRPMMTICFSCAAFMALVVVTVVVHGVAGEGARRAGGIPEGVEFASAGLDVGGEVDTPGVVLVGGPRRELGAVSLEVALGADGFARAGAGGVDIKAGSRVATDVVQVVSVKAEV